VATILRTAFTTPVLAQAASECPGEMRSWLALAINCFLSFSAIVLRHSGFVHQLTGPNAVRECPLNVVTAHAA
jgi:hypothetical protein